MQESIQNNFSCVDLYRGNLCFRGKPANGFGVPSIRASSVLIELLLYVFADLMLRLAQ